jgi:hypothetical protein
MRWKDVSPRSRRSVAAFCLQVWPHHRSVLGHFTAMFADELLPIAVCSSILATERPASGDDTH